ncbi:MAG: diguanylate cyclase, partial [Lachnospiraceae bacterium]|nr:diguanylate cyclase [Lachnospiraceae bacterium]
MKKILIVDDEPVMLKLVSRALKDHYETIQASSGEEGARLFFSEHPDMVLSDLKMPVMSGYELQEIIQAKSDSPVPFIFMTADENDENESRGLEQGAADYIHKPINAEVLLKRIDRIFVNVEENSQLKKLANTDAMTGLYNKTATEEMISDRLKKAHGTFCVVDLDNFKLVNDMFGHQMGDRILVRFAKLIRSVVREGDIVGRIGGDEFVVF